MPTMLPALTSRRVTDSSSLDGVGSPDGWLCASTIAAALASSASRNTSRGDMKVWSSEPTLIVAMRTSRCLVSSSAAAQCSRSAPTKWGASTLAARSGEVIASPDGLTGRNRWQIAQLQSRSMAPKLADAPRLADASALADVLATLNRSASRSRMVAGGVCRAMSGDWWLTASPCVVCAHYAAHHTFGGHQLATGWGRRSPVRAARFPANRNRGPDFHR